MSGQGFGPAGTGDTQLPTEAPIVRNKRRSFESQPDIWGCSFPRSRGNTLTIPPLCVTSHQPLSHPRCPVIPIRTVGVSIRLGSWVAEQNRLGAADVAGCVGSRGPGAGSNFVQASPQHLLFQLLHVCGEETFFILWGDLNASFESSSYLDAALASNGSKAAVRSCKIRKEKD